MSNRKLPKNVVKMRGNPGKRPVNEEEPEPQPLDGIPDPPRKLKPEAQKEWDRIIGFVVNNRIAGLESLSLLCTYCNIHAQIVEREILGAPIEAATITQYRLLASEFGLTPAGRSRLKTGNAKEENIEEKRFFG